MEKNVSPRIQKAIDIYLGALNNGTLVKGSCSACAVGNLTAAAMGATLTPRIQLKKPESVDEVIVDLLLALSGDEQKIERELIINSDKRNNVWGSLFFTNQDGVQVPGYNPLICHCGNCENDPEAVARWEKEQQNGREILALTDFSIEELMKIEHSFETNTKICITDYLNHTKEEIRQDQINGLNAVVSVMLTFEDQNPSLVTELFTEKANLIPIN